MFTSFQFSLLTQCWNLRQKSEIKYDGNRYNKFIILVIRLNISIVELISTLCLLKHVEFIWGFAFNAELKSSTKIYNQISKSAKYSLYNRDLNYIRSEQNNNNNVVKHSYCQKWKDYWNIIDINSGPEFNVCENSLDFISSILHIKYKIFLFSSNRLKRNW